MDVLEFNYRLPSSLKEMMIPESIFRFLLLLLAGIFAFAGVAKAQDGPLTLSVTATPDPVQPGGEVTFVYTITNQSEDEVSGVELETTVPAHVESFPGEADDASGYFCNEGFAGETCDPGETMKWELGTLPAGQGRSATFAVIVKSGDEAPPEEAGISSSGSVASDNTGGGSASVGVTALSNPAFSLYMSGSKSSVSPGQEITYALSYGNSTGESQSNVVLRAPIPSGASFVSASGGGLVEDGEVRWTVGEVGSGEIGRRTFTVQTDSDLSDGAVLSSLAKIESSGVEEAQSGTVTTVQQDAPLSLQASADPDPVQSDGQVQFTVTATNQSGSELTGLVIRTTVPAYVESFPGETDDASGYFCNEGFAGETCDPGEVMKWNFDTLPDGQSQSATFAVQLLSGSDAPPENTVLSTGATFTADSVGGGGATASVLASTASYEIDETVDGRFQTSLNEEDSTYSATVQLKADPGETDLGTSTVRVGYNPLALEYDSASFANYDGQQLSFTGGIVSYNSTVEQPDPGVLALNITKESSTDGNGQALESEWTDVATLTFEVTSPNSTSNLNWPNQDIYNRLGAPDGEYQRGTFTASDQPLPVEMAGFDAEVDDEAVQLTWQTANEENNAGFEVQRRAASEPDVTWQKVGFVESNVEAGTTNESQSYRFTDEDLPFAADRLQYRLRQVDLDGTEDLTDPIEIERTVQRLELRKTFPNPARGQATVQFAVPDAQDVRLDLYDVLGRQVRTVAQTEVEGRQELQVDLSGLSSGVYFLRLNAEDQTETRRLTVVR